MSRYQYRSPRQMVEEALLQIPMGEQFTIWGLSQSITARNAPTRLQISNVLAHCHLAVCRDGEWYREDC